MDKLDLKKSRKALFTAPRDRFVPIDVPPILYLMADGHGDPNIAPEYKRAVESLYCAAYTLKFMAKERGADFVVAPLEGLWSAPDPESFTARRKHEWDWTMMIMVPDAVVEADFAAARAKAAQKLGDVTPSLRLEMLDEGHCLQALHIGSYDDEAPLLAHLHDDVMPKAGYRFAGRHHEIYIGDPRKTAPARLRTIIRQPVSKG